MRIDALNSGRAVGMIAALLFLVACSQPPPTAPPVVRSTPDWGDVSAPSPAPTKATTPTPTAMVVSSPVADAPSEAPVINAFSVDKSEDIAPGDRLTFSWVATAGMTATLTQIQPNGMVGGLSRFDLPASGQVTIVAGEARDTQTFELTVANTTATSEPMSLTLRFRCPNSWFFTPEPDFCPDGPPESLVVAEQPFEGGRMVWVPENDGGVVYVLFPDGTVLSRVDNWTEGQPETDASITPPPDRFQPRRGFGVVWREGEGVRQRLGWALAEEIGADTQVQRESGGVDFKGTNLFLRLADRSVIQITGRYVPNSWRIVAD